MNWPPHHCPHCGHDAENASRKLDTIINQLGVIMTDQDTANAVAAQIEADVQRTNAAVALVAQEIAALQAAAGAGQPLDFTAVNQAVADLGTATGAVEGLEPAAPPAE